MIDHVAIPVRDLATSRNFYEPLLEGLGAKVVMEWPGGVLFGTDDGMVALRESEQVAPLHVAFKADRAGVDSFHETALASGGSDNVSGMQSNSSHRQPPGERRPENPVQLRQIIMLLRQRRRLFHVFLQSPT